jgi:8-oxo-dGTP diphosphatase
MGEVMTSIDNLPYQDRDARPKVAVDTVLFAITDARLRSYLIPIENGPLTGRWAFPGGLVQVGEMLDGAARRHLQSSTGVCDAYLEQLFTFGDPSRDPNSHVVSVAYMALIPDANAVTSPQDHPDDHPAGKWFEVTALPPLAYDHSLMADYAVKRLKAKLEYTNIAYSLLPNGFTFAELEQLYAMILARPIDRRNFRRRIMAMGLLRKSGPTRRGPHRPAALYSFKQQSLQTIEML